VTDYFVPLFMMLELVARRAHEFDVIHAHLDYFGYPMLLRLATPSLTTLHGRLDLPELRLSTACTTTCGSVHFEFAALPAAAAELRRDGTPRAAEGPARERARHGRIPRIFGAHFAGKSSRCRHQNCARAGMPLKIAAKVDKVDIEYYKTTVQPLLAHGGVEFVGEIGEHQKSEFLGNATALLFRSRGASRSDW